MSTLNPDQLRTRERIERLIGLAAPVLNVVLAVGEHLSKLVEPEDTEYYPPRTGAGAPAAPPASGPAGGGQPA